jgi:hypothetical protein
MSDIAIANRNKSPADRQEEKVKDFQNRYKGCQEERKLYEPTWEEIIEFTQPGRETFNELSRRGRKIASKVFDGTPGQAQLIMGDGMQGNMADRSLKWQKYGVPYNDIEDNPDVKAWLQDIEEGMYEEFNRSNFYSVQSEFYDDTLSVGLGTMYPEEDIENERINFTVRHPFEIYIAVNRWGEVDTLFRKYHLEARVAVKVFEADKDKLSDGLKDAARNTPYKAYTFIQGVFPREDRIPGREDAQNKRWFSGHMEEHGKEILDEKGYDDFPFLTWRYRVNSGETYPISPGWLSLVDVHTLNRMAEDTMYAAQMHIMPPWNIPAHLAGKAQLFPHGQNVLKENGQVITAAYTASGNFPISLDMINDRREIIKRHYHTDVFLMLMNAERQMTAYEIRQRQGEKAVVLGPTIGRVNSDFYRPLCTKVFKIAYLAGRLPQAPDILVERGGEYKLDFMGPLTQLQNELFTTQGILQGMEAAGPLMEIWPETADVIDKDKLIRELLSSFGFPEKVLNDQDIVKAIREARAKQQQQQQQMAMISEGADMVPKLSKPVEENSVLDMLKANA